MTDRTITALIVGCGIIGRHHGVVLTQHPSFTVTGLADPDPAMIDAASAAIVGAGGTAPAAYESLSEALEARTADVAVICTPSGLHIQQALAALEYDVHLVIEKPLDVSVEKARQLIDAAERAAERVRKLQREQARVARQEDPRARAESRRTWKLIHKSVNEHMKRKYGDDR